MIDNLEIISYYCNKCKSYPLFQITPLEKEIKIYVDCKCKKQYMNIDEFNKIFLKKEKSINIKKENNNNIKDDQLNISNLINHYNNAKNRLDYVYLEIKNKMIEIYMNKIKEIEKLYENCKIANNKIDNIIQNLIINYELNQKNLTNFNNLVNNISEFNKNILKVNFNNINDNYLDNFYYKNKYLSQYNGSIIDKNINFGVGKKEIIIYLENDIIASLTENNFIEIHKISKNSKIKFNSNYTNISGLTKTENGNLISCGERRGGRGENESFIKIWPKMNSEDYSSLEEEKSYKNIEMSPLIEQKIDSSSGINKIKDIGGEMIIASDKEKIYLFKYNINKENIENNTIKLIKSVDYKICDFIHFKSSINGNLIICHDYDNIFLLNLPDLQAIGKVNCRIFSPHNCSLLQLNENEIIACGDGNIKIINVKKCQVRITKKIQMYMNSLTILKDGTIALCYKDEIKRLSQKNLKELPFFYKKSENEFLDDDEEMFGGNYIQDFDGLTDDPLRLYELNDRKILICFRYSMKLYEYKI